MNGQTMYEVRVITYDGELVAHTDHLDSKQAAVDDFNETATELLSGQVVQLIVDDMIAAQYAPEFHGAEHA